MKISIDSSGQFQDAFYRAERGEQFSYHGLKALFNYLDDLDPDYELDVIGLCCEFTECSLSEALKNYDLESLDELRENTTVIMVDNENDEDPTIIYQNY